MIITKKKNKHKQENKQVNKQENKQVNKQENKQETNNLQLIIKPTNPLDELDNKYPSLFFSSLYSKILKNKLYHEKKEPPKLNFANEFTSLLKLLENKKNSLGENTENTEEEKKFEFICQKNDCSHCEDTPIEILDIKEIKNIEKLIELGDTFHCKINKMFYNINLRVLSELKESLSKLNNIIGMQNVKEKLVDQILYFLQGYHNRGKKCMECVDCKLGITCMKNQSDMLHTVITGPPGVGKTMLAKHLAILYNKIGILKSDKFKIVSRSDLIGKYLGETSMKTQTVIDEADGGVLFIDEAYSLGYTGERDFYSKECIDTLTKNLSEKKTFICIIAGYKESLDNCFFKHNEGLNRRFTFRYDLDKYSWKELKQIFEIKVKQDEFKIGYNSEIDNIFKDNEKYFFNNGGDMETLYLKTKLAHCRDITIKPSEQFILTHEDVKKGILDLIETRKNKKDDFHSNMFL
jgi:hypothetical protein